MNTEGETSTVADNDRLGPTPLVVTLVALAALAIFGYLSTGSPADKSLFIAFSIAQTVVISIIIWQACDPFADAAQWIGRALHLPGSVRGATLDAVASSMPELFTGIFFVVVASLGAEASDGETARNASDGYGSAIATCAGSAIYNMMLIPAFCALIISFKRPQRPTIDVGREVIRRDGLWYIACEVLLIAFLLQPALTWWMALVMLALYVIYVYWLYTHASSHRRTIKQIHAHFERVERDEHVGVTVEQLQLHGIEATHEMVETVRVASRRKYNQSNGEEEKVDFESAGFLFRYFRVPLSHFSAWGIIAVATAVAGAACYWLVEVTNATAHALEIPVFFVAVILVAAASSVPDTFLSIGAARRGDDSGAVSNAFGSNVFDICVCLSLPLLLNCYLVGWQPVSLTAEGGEPMEGLVDLVVLLATLSVATLAMMWHRHQLTRGKALALCALYGVFIAYAVIGSLGYSFSDLVQSWA